MLAHLGNPDIGHIMWDFMESIDFRVRPIKRFG